MNSKAAGTEPSFGDEAARGGESSSRVETETVVRPTADDYSWAELKRIAGEISSCDSVAAAGEVAKFYHLTDPYGKLTGMEAKKVTMSDHYAGQGWVGKPMVTEVQVLGFWHDDTEAGCRAGITFGFKDVVGRHIVSNVGDRFGAEWALDSDWPDCEMRKWLNVDFFKTLPPELQEVIEPVRKCTLPTPYADRDTLTTSDRIWLPSLCECYGVLATFPYYEVPPFPDRYEVEGSQYKLYSDNGVNIVDDYDPLAKTFGGSGSKSWWWLRSPDLDFQGGYHIVMPGGSRYDQSPRMAGGVSPCFAL